MPGRRLNERFHLEVSGCCSGVLVLPFWSGGLVEIPLMVGSAGDLGGSYLALSHGALCGSCFVGLVSCVFPV